MNLYKKRTVIITGAGRGLGAALTRKFAKENYDIVFVSKNSKPPEDIRESIVKVFRGDLSHTSFLKDIVESCSGKIHVLINNAGVRHVGGPGKLGLIQLAEMVDVNFFTPMLLTYWLWDTLSKNQGVVVNINSLSANMPGPGEWVYSATKAGLQGMSKGLQFDATEHGVRVFNVELGKMATDMGGDNKKGVLIDPNEVASFIIQLCHCNEPSFRIPSVELCRRQY